MAAESAMAREEGVLVFRPRPSKGWRAPLLMAVLMFILPTALGSLVLLVFTPDLWWLALLVLLFGMAPALLLLALSYWFPTMRYEFRDDGLWLLYGPIFRYHLPTGTITGAQWRDLGYAYVKTVRTPSLALGTIRYVDVGPVKMVATSPHKRVLVIETTNGRYGVTPEDEAEFIAALPVSKAISSETVSET